jgi:hypothetical protein
VALHAGLSYRPILEEARGSTLHAPFIEKENSMSEDTTWTPITYENCDRITGPFYHGTAAVLEVGDLLVPGFASNYQKARVSNNIYFSSTVASLGAEMAAALAGIEGRGRVYIVEPTGPFEDDPNVTNKRFPGNPTRSYRSRHPLRVIGEVMDWEGHDLEVIKGMLDRLTALREQGLDVIED